MESALEIIESVPVPHLAEHEGEGAGGTQVVALADAAGANASSHYCRNGSAEGARRAAAPSGRRGDCASLPPPIARDEGDPTCDSPRRKKKKDTRKGSEWLNSRRKKTRWSSKKRKKPRGAAWPVGPAPEPIVQYDEQVRREELAWALQSIEKSDSEDEQPSATASPVAATALSTTSGSAARKKRKVDRHSSSPAEPATEEELEFGSPLLPDTDDAVEPPHPLRCGLRYDNMRRLHQHATTDTQRRVDPTSSSGSNQEGNHSEGACDGGKEFEGQELVHRLRKYTCKENDSVTTVCRKLKIPNARVREVLEVNRRRLAYVPHFRQSAKLRKGHVLLVPDENAVLKTKVTAWDGWCKDGENWIETWTGTDQDGLQHDLEAEDIYTGTGFDVRGDTPGHQIIGQRVHGDSPLLVVAHMPAMDEGPMSGPALWKVHYEDKDGVPNGQREDLEQFELEEKIRASDARLSISDGQPPPGQRDPGAVVTERSPSGGKSASGTTQRRTSLEYQNPRRCASLWLGRSTRSFMVIGELRKLARRGGLPQSSLHDSSLAMEGRCRCGCRAQHLDLKQKALQSVNMAKLIDIELHKRWFCGEIYSRAPEVHRCTRRCGRRRNGHGKHAVNPENEKDQCHEDHDHTSQQMEEVEGSGPEPELLEVELSGEAIKGLLEVQQENDPKHVLEVRTPADDDYDTQGSDQDGDATSVGEPGFQPVDESKPSEGCSDSGGALESGARGTPEHVDRIEDGAKRVPELYTSADDYDTQGFDLDDDDTSLGNPGFQPVDESGQSEVCSGGGGGALELGTRGTPEHVDLTADTNQIDSTDDEEEERRIYSQRHRVKTDAFDPFLESCKPQWSAAEKKRRTRDTGTAAVADSNDASPAGSVRSNVDVPSRSVSRNSDSVDESNCEPPEHVMLELFCGTCTVSQRAQAYWGNRVKRVTLDFNDKLHPELDGDSDHHLVSDLLSITDVQKWVKSLLDKISKEWGAPAISFVWASPDCSQYSTANTSKTYHEKDEGLLKADNLVRRTREIINELGAHAAKVHVPFQYIIENPSGGRLRERDVIKDLPFFDVSYCH